MASPAPNELRTANIPKSSDHVILRLAVLDNQLIDHDRTFGFDERDLLGSSISDLTTTDEGFLRSQIPNEYWIDVVLHLECL